MKNLDYLQFFKIILNVHIQKSLNITELRRVIKPQEKTIQWKEAGLCGPLPSYGQ